MKPRLHAALWLAALALQAQSPPPVFDRHEAVAPGISLRERRFMRGADGPFTIQILEVDPRHPAVDLRPVRANDRAIGRETASSMAKRLDAVAAVNGGYFVTTGPYSGASTGVYALNGEVISAGAKRTALLFCKERDKVERLAMSVVDFSGRVRSSTGRTAEITGVNRERRSEELVLYKPRLGPSALTGANGVEARVDSSGAVMDLEDGKGNASIPPDGFVLSGAGKWAHWLRANAQPGMRLSLRLKLKIARAPGTRGCKPADIIGAGPKLVERGRARLISEGFAHEKVRHPRTAVAVTKRGTILFVTLDGRQPSSKGMTLAELSAELIDLGATEAMNLDGGGSTTMFVNGAVRNSPSDGKERPLGDAILAKWGQYPQPPNSRPSPRR